MTAAYRHTLRHALTACALSAAILLQGCGEGSGPPTLKILSPHWEGIRIEFERAWNAARAAEGKAPVKIDWLDVGGTSDNVKYIRSAFVKTPDSIDIDMFFGGGVDPYIACAEADVLAPVSVPEAILSNIPPDLLGVPLYDPQGRWYGAALSGFGILYNNVLLDQFKLPRPATWEDLTKPALRSWVGSADPRKSGSTHMMYEIIAQAYGWERGMEIISMLAGNIKGFTQSASTVPKDIATGNIAAGLCIDVYAWSAIEEVGDDRLGFIMPQGLTVVNPDSIAMLKGAPQPELAAEFLRFVLSETGQKLWMLKMGSMPGAPQEYQLNKMPIWPALFEKYGQYTAFSESPFTWQSSTRYDTDKGSARWGIFNDYLGALFIEQHPLCVKAWAKVCALPGDDPRRTLFMQGPMSEDALMAAATNEYTDSRWRSDTLAKWANDARRRYSAIVED
jgi:ABC-type Fe3+ transport system substrate-binding protein